LFPLKLTLRRLTTEIFSLSGISMTREGAYDSLQEVRKMKSKQQISCTVDGWIAEEQIPAPTHLKVIRKRDPDYGLTEDEIQDRNEFIRCYLLKDFEPLMMIHNQISGTDFFIQDCDVFEPEYTAFNTHDFQNQMRPFNKYGYAMKKIMENVKNMAIMYSCCTYSEQRQNVYRKYEAFINGRFRNRRAKDN